MKNMVEWASHVTIVNSLLKGLRYVEEMSDAQRLGIRLNMFAMPASISSARTRSSVPFRIANPASSEVMQPLCGW